LELKNDGVMDDNSGDDDTGEVRWSSRRDESGRGIITVTVIVVIISTIYFNRSEHVLYCAVCRERIRGA